MPVVAVDSFTEEQKKAKADILIKLLDCYFNSIGELQDLFKSPVQLSDLASSLLIMFSRKVLVHYIHVFNLEGQRKDVIKSFCEAIRDQVNNEIKKGMQ